MDRTSEEFLEHSGQKSTGMSIKDRIKSSERLKKIAHFMLIPRNRYRPRWWVRALLNPFVHKKGKNAVFSRKARKDLFPFSPFELGANSLIEDFSVINNAIGPVIIGERTLIGISSVIIGPVTLGNDILIAQNVVISGQNHGYEDANLPISKQKDIVKHIKIEDEVWLGANVVVVAGVTIGKHAVVAAGSVVTKDVPAFSIVAGNPARIIRQYNPKTEDWDRIKKNDK